MANGNTQLIGGFGPETSDHTFTVTNSDYIYFVCANHVSTGMKGLIQVVNTTSIAEAAEMTSFYIYLNPVNNGELTVRAAQQLDGRQLAFYNAQGQLMQTIPVNGMQTQVALYLADGVYTAVLFENDEAVARKRSVFVLQ